MLQIKKLLNIIFFLLNWIDFFRVIYEFSKIIP